MSMPRELSVSCFIPILLLAVACSESDDNGGDEQGSGGASAASSGGSPGTPSGGSSSASGGGPSSSGGSSSGGSSSGGTTSDDPYGQARLDCVDRINAFRATEDLPPLERWVEQEACTDTQSEADSSDDAHANFGQCSENAQNTCPGLGSVDQIIQGCLQSMWDEGPGEPFEEHGHYINMSNTSYTKVACGFYEMPNGQFWSNQNFR